MAINLVGPGSYRPVSITAQTPQGAPAAAGTVLPGGVPAPSVPSPVPAAIPMPGAVASNGAGVVAGASLPGATVILPVLLPSSASPAIAPDIYIPPPVAAPTPFPVPANAAVRSLAGTTVAPAAAVQQPAAVQMPASAIRTPGTTLPASVPAALDGPPEQVFLPVQQSRTPAGTVSTQPNVVSPMAIERITSTALAPLTPLVTQRPESGALALPPLATPGVPPLLPVDPFSTLLPEGAPGPTGRPSPGINHGQAATEQAAPTPQGSARDSQAMQENQVFFSRQVVWQAPDASALATSWRVMVKTYGEQAAAQQDQARGMHIPASLLMAEANPAALREGQRAPQLVDSDAWRFGVYGWGGQRMMLRVLHSDAECEQAGKSDSRRRRARVALRLGLQLSDGARVVVQMEPVGDGIALELSTALPATLRQLRELLPQLVETIAAAGIRIVHCRIGQAPFPMTPGKNVNMQTAAAALTQGIFRAMAEAALLMTRPATPVAPPAPLAAAVPPSTYQQADEQAGIPQALAAPLPELIDASAPHGDSKWEV